MRILILLLVQAYCIIIYAQPSAELSTQFPSITCQHGEVKNQGNTGTCWSFATVSLLESQALTLGKEKIDLSEMFFVRNIYTDKATQYVLRQGTIAFSAGGLGHDAINALHEYGAVPESVYSGLLSGKDRHDHSELHSQLLQYLNGVLASKPIREDWMKGFQLKLDEHLGSVPDTFVYQNKTYTPRSYADEVLNFKKDDYVFLTSFTHHSFYKEFILEVPDNYANQAYLNLPIEELLGVASKAIKKGYSVIWNGDVTSEHFKNESGLAVASIRSKRKLKPDDEEISFSQAMRQSLFENLTTQDDHLMHIVGLEQSPKGKLFFIAKNSWGVTKPFHGYIKMSEAYFAINTISLVVPKEALDESVKNKILIK